MAGARLMIDRGRHAVCGVKISAVDYEAAVAHVIDAAKERTPFAVSALAVHGVMTGVLDKDHAHRLNTFDMLVPDGQPVRWAMNLLHRIGLTERVYGPNLMLEICAAAERDGVSIYLYGSREEVLGKLRTNLQEQFPKLKIAGTKASRFRQLNDDENKAMVDDIRNSGAQIVFVGLGCPRQEVWVYENAPDLSMPALAVGAAFDFHAGLLSQAPYWMQKRGLEWVYRLYMEPKRLWKRYLFLNPYFCFEVAKQYFSGKSIEEPPAAQPKRMNYG